MQLIIARHYGHYTPNSTAAQKPDHYLALRSLCPTLCYNLKSWSLFGNRVSMPLTVPKLNNMNLILFDSFENQKNNF